jgi:hypothetical protein
MQNGAMPSPWRVMTMLKKLNCCQTCDHYAMVTRWLAQADFITWVVWIIKIPLECARAPWGPFGTICKVLPIHPRRTSHDVTVTLPLWALTKKTISIGTTREVWANPLDQIMEIHLNEL